MVLMHRVLCSVYPSRVPYIPGFSPRRVTSKPHVSRSSPNLISVNFDAVDQLMIRYSAFVKIPVKNMGVQWDSTLAIIGCKKTSD
jgi:hypothetical protein